MSGSTGPDSADRREDQVPGDEFTPLRILGRASVLRSRLFITPAFYRIWLAQVVSATGDWLGLLAISILAIRLGSGNEGAALSLVLAARIVPGFFFGPVAGVLVAVSRQHRRPDHAGRRESGVVHRVGRGVP